MIRTKLLDLKKQSPLASKDFYFIAGELLNFSFDKLIADLPTLSLTPAQLIKFNKIQNAILSGTPLQHIFKKAHFFGNDFIVDESVLIPRPETELLIVEARDFIQKQNNKKTLKVLDLATGSGIIAITLKKLFPDIEVTASDISSPALKLANRNARKHQTKINFVESNLFQKVRDQYDLICSNLPYISEDDPDLCELRDPKLALIGGKPGFELIEKTISSLGSYLNEGGMAIFEIGYDQGHKIALLAKEFGFKVRIIKDLNDYDRVAVLEYKTS